MSIDMDAFVVKKQQGNDMQTVEQRETETILAMGNKIKELQDVLKEVHRICHDGSLDEEDSIVAITHWIAPHLEKN